MFVRLLQEQKNLGAGTTTDGGSSMVFMSGENMAKNGGDVRLFGLNTLHGSCVT